MWCFPFPFWTETAWTWLWFDLLLLLFLTSFVHVCRVFLRSCVQGWWRPSILHICAPKLGKKKVKVRRWADSCILIVCKCRGNCLLKAASVFDLTFKACSWNPTVTPFLVPSPVLLNLKLSADFAWLLKCLDTPWALPAVANAFWSSLCYRIMRAEWCHLPPTRLRTSVSLDHLWYFPQSHSNTVFSLQDVLKPLARQFENQCLLRYVKFQAKPAWKLQPCLLFQGVLWVLANRGGSCTIALNEKRVYVFDFYSSEVLKALRENTLLTSWCVGCGIIFNSQEQLFKRSLCVR